MAAAAGPRRAPRLLAAAAGPPPWRRPARPWAAAATAAATASRPRRFGAAAGAVDAAAAAAEELHPLARASLAERRPALVALHEQVAAAPPEALSALGVGHLCRLLRALASAGVRPEARLLERAVQQVVAQLGGAAATDHADDAAALALAACEAGHATSLGAQLVDAACGAGLASAGAGGPGAAGLGGTGAAWLALAAAAAGRLDAALLEALLGRCSAREGELRPEVLGDVRLAACLAGGAAVEALDVRAAGFLRTVCAGADLDDPRGCPPSAASLEETLTPMELELSEALTSCEVPHCRGALMSGVFFPLSSIATRTVVCAEDEAARAVYANAPAERAALQQWKYQAAAASGWKVFAVRAADWQAAVGAEEAAALVRGVLAGPPAAAAAELAGGA